MIALAKESDSTEMTMLMTEPVLCRIARGDSEAIDECIGRYGRLVWMIARRFSSSPADAEDAVQEIFIELWQKAPKYDPEIASESTFVTMLARRRMIDRFRKKSRSIASTSICSDSWDFLDPPSPDRLEIDDEVAKANRCLEALKANQREILKRSIHDGWSHAQISTELKLPLGTVKSFVRRGLNQLRECMQQIPRSATRGAT